MKTIYLIKYSVGSYEDYKEITVFATAVKKVATKYVTKANKILKKWKDYYSQFEDNRIGIKWIKEEYIEKYYNRWSSIKAVNRFYWEEIEVR